VRARKRRDISFNNGRARRTAIELLATGTSPNLPVEKRQARLISLAAAVTKLDAISSAPIDADPFLRWAIHDQAVILASLYRAVILLANQDHYAARNALLPAAALMHKQTGRWATWYHGDSKIDIAGLIARCEQRAHIG
jgi:hypothetical protein